MDVISQDKESIARLECFAALLIDHMFSVEDDMLARTL
jgi:hypothetical protein